MGDGESCWVPILLLFPVNKKTGYFFFFFLQWTLRKGLFCLFICLFGGSLWSISMCVLACVWVCMLMYVLCVHAWVYVCLCLGTYVPRCMCRRPEKWYISDQMIYLGSIIWNLPLNSLPLQNVDWSSSLAECGCGFGIKKVLLTVPFWVVLQFLLELFCRQENHTHTWIFFFLAFIAS